MSDLKKSVLDTIKKEDVKPKPKWWFVVMHSIVWVGAGISVIVGSIATAVVFHEIFETDWMVVERLEHDGIPGFLLVLPYLWFGALGITLLAAYYLYRHTENGYKKGPVGILIGTVVISVILGSVLYERQVPERVKDVMVEHLPPFAEFEMHRQEVFMAPERGVLVGVITDVQGDKLMVLNDIREREWSVDIAGARYGDDLIEVDKEVVCLGEKKGDFGFVAVEVRPLRERFLKRLIEFRKKVERNVKPPM